MMIEPSDCDNKSVLDLSKKHLQKIPKQDDAQHIRVLILDDNELQKIDNVDSFLCIEQLSICKNQLLRMYGVSRMHQLQHLHLAYNGILTIEGLKELGQLTHLNLEGNNIKAIEHLNTNLKLEYLNLSENSIGNISDLSNLKCLKELNLQGNRITHLSQCEKYLPVSLEQFLIAKNAITDLNEICSLAHLCNLQSITIVDNPCVQMTGSVVGFDHRPFVLNWCMTVKAIDGFVVNPIESLKAEWLYSQGRGRQFRIGEQTALARYLSSVCPLSGEVLENENERKLRLILSKAQQHQRQLQAESSDISNTSGSNSPSSARRKGQSSRIQSPRFSRLGRQGSPDSMSNSYHGHPSNVGNATQLMQTSLIGNIKGDSNIMVQSLDPTILSSSSGLSRPNSTGYGSYNEQPSTSPRSSPQSMMISSGHFNEQMSLNNRQSGCPLAAATKMVPVPESLMSPDCAPTNAVHRAAATPVIYNRKAASPKPKSDILSSPKSARLSTNGISPQQPKQRSADKSPILSHTRKTHQNLANSLQMQRERDQQQLQHMRDMQNKQHKPLVASSVVHVTPLDARSSFGNSDEDDDRTDTELLIRPAHDDAGDDSDNVNTDKLRAIRNRAAQRSNSNHKSTALVNLNVPKERQQRRSSNTKEEEDRLTEISAILIQKLWRGHQARLKFKAAAKVLQSQRTQNYIEKLTADMETTKVALENERKIQQLQMQAINALWKKVSTMQPNATLPTTDVLTVGNLKVGDNHSQAIVQDLAKTCTVLTNQVQQLQGSMHDILQCMTVFCNLPQSDANAKRKPVVDTMHGGNAVGSCSSTQTEIVAVHTPQVDNPPFPFRPNHKLQRPSTLPLDANIQTSPPQPLAMTQIAEDDIPHRQMNTFSKDDESADGVVGTCDQFAAMAPLSNKEE